MLSLALKRIILILFPLIIFFNNLAHSEITFEEILEDPSDLELNLQYAKEQEKTGNYKNTIATLERLNMLYPVNTDIKVYLLSILLEIDSAAKLQLMIDTMLQDPNTTADAREYIEGVLKIIQDQSKPKNKWFAYADVNYTHTENSNIEGKSKSGTMWFRDGLIDFSPDTMLYDKTYSKGISITTGKNIDSTSAISLNAGIKNNTQNKGGAEENDLTSVSGSYSKILGKHYILPYIYYSRPNYRNDSDDLNTLGLGFSNTYNLNQKKTISYGSSYAITNYDRVARNAAENPNQKNNETYVANVGYSQFLSDKDLLSSNISYINKIGEADFNGYNGADIKIGYTKLLSIGTVIVDRTLQKKYFDHIDTNINSIIRRKDETKISKIQLTGNIKQILPFVSNIDQKGETFYNISFTETNTSTTLVNYSAIRRNMSINITKRFSFNE